MGAARVRKFSDGLVVIGYLLWVPALLLVLGAMAASTMGIIGAGTEGDPGVAAGVGAVGLVLTGGTFIVAAPFLIVGLVLTMRKNVWQCGNCRSIFDRA